MPTDLRMALAALAFASLAVAGPAAAQVDLVSTDTVHGLVDVRATAADGEQSFVDGGFGKTRASGDAAGDWRLNGRLAVAALEWRPRFGWDWSGLVDVIAQPDQDEHTVDLSQAYVLYRPAPRSATSITARFGLFYPPISLEHDGPVWGLTNTITPSAINSWVGEELKVIGIEGGVARELANGQRVALTVGVFGGDDTAGTLLTYRGWAMHDLQATAYGAFNLPPLGELGQAVQPPKTYSIREIDQRLGYYARLEWRPIASLELDAFYYDNRGNKTGVTATGQWAWDTRFVAAGARWTIDEQTQVLAQAISGRTQDGFPTPQGLFGDVDFQAAYALISHDIGRSTATGRIDAFSTSDNTTQDLYRNDEHGWAVTGAWLYRLSQHADLRVEALHVWSARPTRGYAGLAAGQSQTVLRSSLRASF